MGGARPSGLCHLLAVTGGDLPLLTRGLSISIPQTAKEAIMLLLSRPPTFFSILNI